MDLAFPDLVIYGSDRDTYFYADFSIDSEKQDTAPVSPFVNRFAYIVNRYFHLERYVDKECGLGGNGYVPSALMPVLLFAAWRLLCIF